MRVQEHGAESCILDGNDDIDKMDSHKPILQLRSLLLKSSLFPECAKRTLDGSSSPCTTCSTTSIDESGLGLSMSSQDSVASSVPDELQSEVDSTADSKDTRNSTKQETDFFVLRITYLLVTLVIMLADGLQGKKYICCKLFDASNPSHLTALCLMTGTHLYVLYEGYGFSVAWLYCLGFATGGLMSPITGPLVDKIGRKKSAILYCTLEIFINMLEQYPALAGLIVSRMIGGFTTNLLSSVFETWLDTEYRRRGLEKEKYELIMRDSVIVSNTAAIFSGYLAHVLAQRYGAVGPFEGAVTCTAFALVVVCVVWTENYGSSENDHAGSKRGMMGYLKEAITAYKDDEKMLRVGLLQGLTAGSIQIFVFLWAPTLRHFAQNAPKESWGLDENGEVAYGLIFGAFMCAGVLGGCAAPKLRKLVTVILSPIVDNDVPMATIDVDGEGCVAIRPMAVEGLSACCYFLSAFMLFVPYFCQSDGAKSFSYSLAALLFFEFLIGVFLPCEGVIRSLYFPVNARASVMTLPRITVNIAVAIGVVSTNYVR